MIHSNIKSLFLVTGFLFIFSLLLFNVDSRVVSANGKREQTITMQGKPKGGDFTLQSADGPVSLHDMGGKVVILIFGYTMCPAVCPTTLTLIANVLTQLKAEDIKLVRVLFISIDPERDTLDKLKKFTSNFHPSIIGITDRPEVVLRVADQYGSLYFKEKVTDSAMGYTFLHDTALHLVAPDGRLSETFSHKTSADTVVKTIRRILGEEKY